MKLKVKQVNREEFCFILQIWIEIQIWVDSNCPHDLSRTTELLNLKAKIINIVSQSLIGILASVTF